MHVASPEPGAGDLHSVWGAEIKEPFTVVVSTLYMKLSFLYCHSGACSEWRQVDSRINGLSDFCVGWTLSVTILFPPCLLQVETGPCPHWLNYRIYCHHDACSKWRQGGARITELSDLLKQWLWYWRLKPHFYVDPLLD